MNIPDNNCIPKWDAGEAPWEYLNLPTCFRKLTPEMGMNLRDDNVARSWVHGMLGFSNREAGIPKLRKYARELSKDNFFFFKEPPRWIVRELLSKVLKKELRSYTNFFGEPLDAISRGDPLLSFFSKLNRGRLISEMLKYERALWNEMFQEATAFGPADDAREQLSPGLIGLSPPATSHPLIFQH